MFCGQQRHASGDFSAGAWGSLRARVDEPFVDFLFCPNRTIRLGRLDAYAQEHGFAKHLDIEEMAKSIQEQAEEVLPLFEIQIVEEENYLQMVEEDRKELINLSSDFLNELLLQQKQIEVLNQQVAQDSLTGLMNFQSFNETLERELNRSLRYDLPLSLIFSDIDHFKNVNDTYGHQAGNHALQCVAGCLQTGLRDSDSVARYGGEEFAIILPETDLAGAGVVAERLRTSVQQLQSEFEGRTISVTMSFGTACFSYEEDATKSGFIQRADQALYRAKQTGRNRCCSYTIEY